MEELLQNIPNTKDHFDRERGENEPQGLCLRYSPKRDKWLCGYGSRMRPRNEGKYFVEADDPVEALAFFVELLNKKNT